MPRGELLLNAAKEGDLQRVKTLIRRGVNVNYVNSYGNTALFYAVGLGHRNIVEVLLNGTNVNHGNMYGETALFTAVVHGHVDIADFLLQNGANPNHTNRTGATALFAAAQRGNVNAVECLLGKGADLNYADGYDETAMFSAALQGHVKVVDCLLQKGADLNHANKEGATALCVAALHGRSSLVEHLLQKGMNVNYMTKNGLSVLHYAVIRTQNARSETVNILLNHGANVNTPCNQGNTPLHVAVKSAAKEDILTAFCHAGCNPFQENVVGRSPLSLLKDNSPLAEKMTIAFRSTQKLQRLWHSAKTSAITKEELFNALQAENISSFSNLVLAHHLIILALRQLVISTPCSLQAGGSDDYLLENVYLPATKLDLSAEQKHWLSGMLSWAERTRIIRPGNSVLVKVVADLRSEIRTIRLAMYSAVVSVARDINRLCHRVEGLEKWTNEAANKFQSLCEGHQGIFLDMRNMAASLQELHALLKQQQRNRTIAGILGFFLSMIPFVGSALSGAALAATEVAFGVNVGEIVSGVDSVVEEVLTVDISSFQGVSVISEQFFQKLDPVSKRRLVAVVEQTDFKTINNLQHSLLTAVEEMNAFERELESSNDGSDSELRQRFSVLSSRSNSEQKTVTAQDAISELQHMHQVELNRGNIDVTVEEEVVDEIVMNHMCEETGQVNFDAFAKSCHDLQAKYPTITGSKEPPELKERFQKATGTNNVLKVRLAMRILRRLFDDSASAGEDSSSGQLTFKRTKINDWDDEEVNSLLRQVGPEEKFVDEEGFVQVGMKILFTE